MCVFVYICVFDDNAVVEGEKKLPKAIDKLNNAMNTQQGS